MRIKEYDSVPSKDSEFEQQENSTNLKENNRNDLGEEQEENEGEMDKMLNDREKDEDETVVNMDENWEDDYEKNDASFFILFYHQDLSF